MRVGGAFHSRLMEPAREGLIEAVEGLTFRKPTVPIVANCTGEELTSASQVKRELVAQISSCVQWHKSIDYMIGAGRLSIHRDRSRAGTGQYGQANRPVRGYDKRRRS